MATSYLLIILANFLHSDIPELKITMQDLRTNYIPLETSDDFYDPGLNKIQMKNAKVETQKQLSQLALNGIKLGDRHGHQNHGSP